jgi:subtilase family serine protease
LATLFAAGPAALAGAGATTPATVAMPGSRSAAATPANDQGAVPASSTISFDVTLVPNNAAGAAALAQQVSDPTSASYKHYVTAAQWESRFSPSAAQVSAVTSWLTSAGLAVGAVTPDRLSVAVSGTAAQVDAAFGTSLHNYSVRGKTVHLTTSDISVPASVSSLIQGTPGLNQVVNTTASAQLPSTPTTASSGGTNPNVSGSGSTSDAAVPSGAPIPPPPGFVDAPPCSQYYGQVVDSSDPGFGPGYPSSEPYANCGYTPQQLRSAYGLSTDAASGISGKGQTVAVVDAYASSTLLSDAQEYYTLNDPGDPLKSGQFSTDIAPTFNLESLCQASSWSVEQSLDIEAVHAMAPRTNILYVGAKNCDNGLLDSERSVVDGHLADIITNSWGDDAGDVLDTSSSRAAYDTVFEMAVATGISVLFSSGDSGDEFATTGLTSADYPPSSPYVTAVGGTSLQIAKNGSRTAELGWSATTSNLCTSALVKVIPGCTTKRVGTYVPPDPGAYFGGSGGGTSFFYPQPYYQAATVPAALSERNSSNGTTPFRVEPDISMDADPFTGMLEGLTQTFGSNVRYGQFPIGGTSLSSPLFAGVLADANQASGADLGFVNPALYKLGQTQPTTLFDVVPGAAQDVAFNNFLNGLNSSGGQVTSIGTLGYEGPEVYCDAANSCETRDVALNTAPGFDSMTGLGTIGSGFIQALASE